MVKPIERDDLAARIANGTIVVLDAQAPGWYERGHLPGALDIAYDDIDFAIARAVPNKDTEVAVYCWNQACLGSAVVAERLDQLGYTHVRRYVGGKQDWSGAGLPLNSHSEAHLVRAEVDGKLPRGSVLLGLASAGPVGAGYSPGP